MKNTANPPLQKKVTLMLPADLVERAPEALGKRSLTEAVRDALQDALHRQACQELIALRGKVKFDLTWQQVKALDD